MNHVIAYDLGTGGIKTTLFDERGNIVKSVFEQCETYYAGKDIREQNPLEWWELLVKTTRAVMEESGISKREVIAAACSGHSLGVVPIGYDGTLLLDRVPIWSDARAVSVAERMFRGISEARWYEMTGNGFPAHLYSVFKILWYREHMPEVYRKTKQFIGTKDYLNYRMTGVLCTDHSYASGSGVYNLKEHSYDDYYLSCFGADRDKLPEITEPSDIIGRLLPQAASELGLSEGMEIASGGVDNACMAAGAGCVREGSVYTSLGTSAWIAVTSQCPVINQETRPYVFCHLVKGMYVSSEAIFSAGNTFRWVRDRLCADLIQSAPAAGMDPYDLMTALAEESPAGANGLYFIPSLAGGSSLDQSPDVRGAMLGMDLKHTRNDILRAAMEGICMGLKIALDELEREARYSDKMLIVGGGAKSKFWLKLFADIYGKEIMTSAIGENAGSLGAMACAAVGAGLWEDFGRLEELNRPVSLTLPDQTVNYDKIFRKFRKLNELQSEIAGVLSEN